MKEDKVNPHCPYCGELLYIDIVSPRKRRLRCSLLLCSFTYEWTLSSKYDVRIPLASGVLTDLRKIAERQREFMAMQRKIHERELRIYNA
jgi:hypothetical protein